MTNAADITFGIEFETTMPAAAAYVDSRHYRRGLSADWLPAGWQMKYDASIRASRGRRGIEFVSPPLSGAAGLRQVCDVVNAIKARGGRVNESTGLHIHVGFDRTNEAALKRLITLTSNFEKAIYASTGTKRREQRGWANPVSVYNDADHFAQTSGRYRVLNVTNLLGRGHGTPTVEFRAFAGTLNTAKVVGYVRLCVGLVERALRAKRVTNWIAKPVKDSSPIHRSGEGQTALTRCFYQLGWTRGRQSHTHGDLHGEGLPTIAASKKVLMRMARKYDAQR